MNKNNLLKVVAELDLEPIKIKLMHVESGEGWSLDKASAVENEYRRFLCLMKLYPHENTAPLVDVDTFWHYHILDTMKYAADCQRVFGYFLHHYPYVGMRGANDEQFRIASGERMQQLYEQTFGDAYPATRAPAAKRILATFRLNTVAVPGLTAANTAWCASEIGKAGTVAANTAWCASEIGKAGTVAADTAWCASEIGKAGTVAANTAWCASEIGKAGTVAADTAWCASEIGKAGTVAADTAWCASEIGKAGAASTAFCGGPDSKVAAQRAGSVAANGAAAIAA